MMEVQKQWVNNGGKWEHKEVAQPALPQRPALPSRTSTAPIEASTPSASLQAPVPRLPPLPPSSLQKPAPRVPPLPPNGLPTPTPRTSSAENSVPVPPRPAARSPALPTRQPSESSSLHARKVSDTMTLSRKDSNESMNSNATAETSYSTYSNGTSITSRSDRYYTIRAPEYDPSALPTLPPKKTKEEKDAEARARRFPAKARKTSASTIPRVTSPPVQPPERPQSTRPIVSQPEAGNLPAQIEEPEQNAAPKRVVPPLPTRNSVAKPLPTAQERPEPSLPPRPQRDYSLAPLSEAPRRQLPPPPPAAKRSALSMGFGNAETLPTLPTRPNPRPAISDSPPPVPLASRPDLAALQASKPKLNEPRPAGTQVEDCLICRDFSGPDNHAARFPRESLPSQDLTWLARQLAAPFTSATDKARCIFTWLHHNIAYDTKSFFSGNLKYKTPQDTLATGLAVCAGYAGLFADLALKMGLEAKAVNGHGKGFGYSPLEPGQAIPPYDMNHAWNTVKIDNGVWKCLDACWGAGAVGCAAAGCGPQEFKKRFAPAEFTKSNEEFGLSHLPEDAREQHRKDGRTISWEEYITNNKNGTSAQVFNGYTTEEGVSPSSFRPLDSPIVLSQQGPRVRFTFQKVCKHWDVKRNGPGAYLPYVMHCEGLDGTQDNHIPFNQGDGIWWLDVPVADLGRPGQKATICAVTELDGRKTRGLTYDEYKRKKGRVAMSFGFVAQWTMA